MTSYPAGWHCRTPPPGVVRPRDLANRDLRDLLEQSPAPHSSLPQELPAWRSLQVRRTNPLQLGPVNEDSEYRLFRVPNHVAAELECVGSPTMVLRSRLWRAAD